MSTLSLRLPESIHQKLGELAEREGISINQLINSAVAEKLAALLTEQYLAERGARADRSKFEAVIAKIPDVPASPGDELPEDVAPKRSVNSTVSKPPGRSKGRRGAAGRGPARE